MEESLGSDDSRSTLNITQYQTPNQEMQIRKKKDQTPTTTRKEVLINAPGLSRLKNIVNPELKTNSIKKIEDNEKKLSSIKQLQLKKNLKSKQIDERRNIENQSGEGINLVNWISY